MFESKDNFDIFLVSLPKDIERRENIGVKPNYTYAIDGAILKKDELLNDRILSKNCSLRRGEIGCYMSHVHLLKKCLTSKKDYVLILEDDAKIEPDSFDKIEEVLKKAPSDFNMLFLGYNYYENFYKFTSINLLHGTQAYLVNIKNLKIEDINRLYPIEKEYDVILPVKFKTYVVIPKIIKLGKFGKISNTQNII